MTELVVKWKADPNVSTVPEIEGDVATKPIDLAIQAQIYPGADRMRFQSVIDFLTSVSKFEESIEEALFDAEENESEVYEELFKGILEDVQKERFPIELSRVSKVSSSESRSCKSVIPRLIPRCSSLRSSKGSPRPLRRRVWRGDPAPCHLQL